METTKPNETWNQPNNSGQPQENKKVLAGIMAIILGGLGIHKFVLGYNVEGIIMLLVSVLGVAFSCLFIPIFGTIGMGLIGLVEGIIYLTKTDEDFYNTYQLNKRGWF